MKRTFLLTVFLLTSAMSSYAQDTKSPDFRRFEIGWDVFSYWHQRRDDFFGTNLSFAVRKSDRLTFVADYGVHTNGLFGADDLITYHFGPRFYAKPRGRVQPFMEILAGGLHLSTSSTPFFGGAQRPPAQNGFALRPGGGFDLRIKPWLAWRAVEADYTYAHVAGSSSSGITINSGILFRFGH